MSPRCPFSFFRRLRLDRNRAGPLRWTRARLPLRRRLRQVRGDEAPDQHQQQPRHRNEHQPGDGRKGGPARKNTTWSLPLTDEHEDKGQRAKGKGKPAPSPFALSPSPFPFLLLALAKPPTHISSAHTRGRPPPAFGFGHRPRRRRPVGETIGYAGPRSAFCFHSNSPAPLGAATAAPDRRSMRLSAGAGKSHS